MTEILIADLRRYAGECGRCKMAADEIERLQRECAQWSSLRDTDIVRLRDEYSQGWNDALKAAADIADTEPEPQGAPPIELIQECTRWGDIGGVVRATVRATRGCIAYRIRAKQR